VASAGTCLVSTETVLVLKTGGRITVPREAIRACRKGGTVSVIGVYGGFLDKFSMGAVMSKALAIRGGQQHGQRYAERPFGYVRDGKLGPSRLHRYPLERKQHGYSQVQPASPGRSSRARCAAAAARPAGAGCAPGRLPRSGRGCSGPARVMRERVDAFAATPPGNGRDEV
jgi:hypothetical protein